MPSWRQTIAFHPDHFYGDASNRDVVFENIPRIIGGSLYGLGMWDRLSWHVFFPVKSSD
jgi:hypothetical protein